MGRQPWLDQKQADRLAEALAAADTTRLQAPRPFFVEPDGTHHPAAPARGRVRPGVVRGDHDHRHGMGLIHPPVGLNIFVIKNIVPKIPLGEIVRGVLPFIALMVVAITLLCIFPDLFV